MRFSFVQNGAVVRHNGGTVVVPWWSLTKTVIAAAALAQVRDKLLSLDDVLDSKPFTLRQLLRHEAGLADYGQLADYHAAVQRGEVAWPADEMLARTQAERLRWAPGSHWSYSNIGYLYVRRLLEQSTGEEFGAALQRLVFRPLGLEHARLARSREDLLGVEMGDATAYDPRWVYHGLIVGPLDEAALLLDRLMGEDLLPPELFAAMRTTRAVGGPIAGRPWLAPAYGLGLMAGAVEGGATVEGHTGGGPGSFIAVYRTAGAALSSCCATFSVRHDQGAVEREAMARLAIALPGAARS